MQDLCVSLHMDDVGEDSVKNACLYLWHVLLRVGILQVDNLLRVGTIGMGEIWRHGCEFNLRRIVFEAPLINIPMKISGKQNYM